MGSHIRATGWDNWKKPESEKTVRYEEYGSSGPGAKMAQRVTWSRQLTAQQARQYTLKRVLAAPEPWLPKLPH
ncbi:pectinesterase family protein [Hymenobacter sp. AT01-02]|uniref:pectinesterase family protein n=1 Tax=Hymenobacter sp. AT01-02 TaxID=1571877 RepID=UPI000A44F0F4|nr:pectinesterase family protein [Hymenobacter sp. AT01-02]